MKTFYTILLLLISTNLFAQDDSVDSIKINVRKAPSIVDDADNPRYLNSDSNKIIIVDGVITNGDFSAEYGFNIHQYRENHYNWYISHSAGLAPEESEGTFYVSISTRVGRGLFLGLRGGIYTFQSPLDSAVNDTIRAFGPYMAGSYTLNANYQTQGPSYIGALFGSYHIGKSFSINGSAGIRLYTEKTWEGTVSFNVAGNNSYPSGVVISPTNFIITETKDKLKPYFSIGADYKTGRFLIGVFGDNVFSFGANIGIGFN